MESITLVGLRETPLTVDEMLAAVADPRAGGTAFFVGSVRDHDHGRGVTELAYSAHPSATVTMREVMERVLTESNAAADPDRMVWRVAALHRVGELKIGDHAVIVAVAAAHRAEAFDVCRRLIDDIKAQVPIWKHQRFTDGATEWVGSA